MRSSSARPLPAPQTPSPSSCGHGVWCRLPVAGEPRYVAVEDVARYRDALGAPLPPGLPEALLEPVRDAAGDLAMRFARSHGPFTVAQLAARYGLGVAVAGTLLQRLTEAGRLIEGEFRPGGTEREWVDDERAPQPARPLAARSCATRSRRSRPTRSAVSWWRGTASGRSGAASRRCSTRSSSSRARRCRPRCSNATSSRRASPTTARRCSTR